MRRREFIGLAGSAAVACSPFPAHAQQPANKVHRVGLIGLTPPVASMAGSDPVNPSFRAFVHGLRDLGHVEGRNLILELRSAEGRYDRFDAIIAELLARKVDVIVTVGNTMALAAKRATSTVPIVMMTSSNPVEAGIVASLARPGGNVTGFTLDAGPEIEAKRLQMLKEAVPEATRVTFLGEKYFWEILEGKSARAAAVTLGIKLIQVEHESTGYPPDVFARILRDRPHALFFARNSPSHTHRQLIADFSLEHRLPGMYAWRENVEAGGLMSYGTNLPDLFRRVAGHVDKILKGTKPADIPVEQPIKFELVINGRTAKALGITIPPTLLTLADEVIE
jgi:putative tryptophan/tyrosine transport system substrate-binding protein